MSFSGSSGGSGGGNNNNHDDQARRLQVSNWLVFGYDVIVSLCVVSLCHCVIELLSNDVMSGGTQVTRDGEQEAGGDQPAAESCYRGGEETE